MLVRWRASGPWELRLNGRVQRHQIRAGPTVGGECLQLHLRFCAAGTGTNRGGRSRKPVAPSAPSASIGGSATDLVADAPSAMGRRLRVGNLRECRLPVLPVGGLQCCGMCRDGRAHRGGGAKVHEGDCRSGGRRAAGGNGPGPEPSLSGAAVSGAGLAVGDEWRTRAKHNRPTSERTCRRPQNVSKKPVSITYSLFPMPSIPLAGVALCGRMSGTGDPRRRWPARPYPHPAPITACGGSSPPSG